ncbi:MAG: hypothetical protein ACTHK6_02930 [Solirubrobacterales bacterium]
MKYVKMLGPAAIAAAALMAFAGTGSASAAPGLLTCGTGTPCSAGTTIKATSRGKITLDTLAGNVECHSLIVGHTTTVEEGGIDGNADGPITTLDWTECGGDTVTTLATGSFSIESNGTFESFGTRITVIHAGVHCIFEMAPTTGTNLGTVTGSAGTKGRPYSTSRAQSRVGGNGGAFCGSTAPWTGSYEVINPNPLDVD